MRITASFYRSWYPNKRALYCHLGVDSGVVRHVAKALDEAGMSAR